jgi:hypothetical protein
MAMANNAGNAPVFNFKRELNVTPPSGYETQFEEEDDKKSNEKMAASEAGRPGSPLNKTLRRGVRNIGPPR